MKKTSSEHRTSRMRPGRFLFHTRKGIAVLSSFVFIIIVALFTTVMTITTANDSSVESSTSVPSNPQESATKWLTNLMDTTSSKFGADFFNTGSTKLNQLMKGDSSFIPESIKDRVHLGSSSDNMTVSRSTLNGSSYAGLIMFSNAYKQTKDKNITTNGYTLSSYDASEKTVYIPAQAIMSTTQEVQFEVKWNGKSWQLQGDPLAWSVYVMLENNAAKSGKGQ